MALAPHGSCAPAQLAPCCLSPTACRPLCGPCCLPSAACPLLPSLTACRPCTGGLWSLSRQANYFGEASFWLAGYATGALEWAAFGHHAGMAWQRHGMACHCRAPSWAGTAASCQEPAALPLLPRHPPAAPAAGATCAGVALLAALRAYQSLPQALGAAVGVAGIVGIIAGESKRRQVPAWRPVCACAALPASAAVTAGEGSSVWVCSGPDQCCCCCHPCLLPPCRAADKERQYSGPEWEQYKSDTAQVRCAALRGTQHLASNLPRGLAALPALSFVEFLISCKRCCTLLPPCRSCPSSIASRRGAPAPRPPRQSRKQSEQQLDAVCATML